MYYLKHTTEMGRGLYATHHLKAGKLIARCELLVLSPQDTVSVNKTDLKYYVFRFNDTQDCLVLGDGEIFNHSDTPNVGYRLEEFDGRSTMIFYSIKYIAKDEQMFINYNADVKVNVTSYILNESLVK